MINDPVKYARSFSCEYDKSISSHLLHLCCLKLDLYLLYQKSFECSRHCFSIKFYILKDAYFVVHTGIVSFNIDFASKVVHFVYILYFVKGKNVRMCYCIRSMEGLKKVL